MRISFNEYQTLLFAYEKNGMYVLYKRKVWCCFFPAESLEGMYVN